MYQGVGLLQKYEDGGTIPSEFAPCDFASEFSNKLPLLKGTLDKEVMFGFPPNITIPATSLPPPESRPITATATAARGSSASLSSLPSSTSPSTTPPAGSPQSTLSYFQRSLQKRNSSESSFGSGSGSSLSLSQAQKSPLQKKFSTDSKQTH